MPEQRSERQEESDCVEGDFLQTAKAISLNSFGSRDDATPSLG
jgi:hypothetical protein